MWKRALATAVLLLTAGAFPISAGLGPEVKMRDIIDQAALICSGRVLSYDLGPSPWHAGEKVLVEKVVTDNLIKGERPSVPLAVSGDETNYDNIPVGLDQRIPKNRWVFFLTPPIKDGYPWTLVGGYEGQIPVGPHVPADLPSSADADTRVEAELLAAATSGTNGIAEHAIRLIMDWGRKTPEVMATLKALSETGGVAVRGRAIATRIWLGDLSALPLAAAYRGADAQDAGLLRALRHVTDVTATPALVSLLKSENGTVRQGASYALRALAEQSPAQEVRGQIGPALRQALDDDDPEVMFNAIMGLAYLTGAVKEYPPPAPYPSIDLLRENPEFYRKAWKAYVTKDETPTPVDDAP